MAEPLIFIIRKEWNQEGDVHHIEKLHLQLLDGV